MIINLSLREIDEPELIPHIAEANYVKYPYILLSSVEELVKVTYM